MFVSRIIVLQERGIKKKTRQEAVILESKSKMDGRMPDGGYEPSRACSSWSREAAWVGMGDGLM